ncbi:MAG: hypothetical protein LBD48_12970, partial [Treponema sp.]|nr:hypothetical protein [Treponema sp.]
MKEKVLAVLMMAAFCAPVAFSQTEPDAGLTVTVDTAIDALYMRRFTGDFAEKTHDANSPYNYQGDGDTKSFKSSNFDEGLGASTGLRYTGDIYGGLLSIKATLPLDGDEPGGFLLGDWNGYLRFGKWGRLMLGNTAQRGMVNLHQNFDDFLRAKIDGLGIMVPVWSYNPSQGKGNFIDPTTNFPWGYQGNAINRGYATFSGTDTTDLFIPAGAAERQKLGVLVDIVPYWEPLTITASLGGLFDSLTRPYKQFWEIDAAEAERANYYDTASDPRIQNRMNFGLRAEYKLPERLYFMEKPVATAVFKYSSAQLMKLESTDTSNYPTIDTKAEFYSMGLYLNAGLPWDLSASIGWSGFSKRWRNNSELEGLPVGIPTKSEEDEYIFMKVQAVLFPFYNGIDLRLSYAPSFLPALRMTLNNNVSFASVQGIDNRKIQEKYYSAGWAYAGSSGPLSDINADQRREYYTGLYNAFAVRYDMTKVLAFNLQIANQAGFFTLKTEGDPVVSTSDRLGIYLGANYSLADNGISRLTFRGGLSLDIYSYGYQHYEIAGISGTKRTDFTAKDTYKAGFINFGIPIGLKLEFYPAAPSLDMFKAVAQPTGKPETPQPDMGGGGGGRGCPQTGSQGVWRPGGGGGGLPRGVLAPKLR